MDRHMDEKLVAQRQVRCNNLLGGGVDEGEAIRSKMKHIDVASPVCRRKPVGRVTVRDVRKDSRVCRVSSDTPRRNQNPFLRGLLLLPPVQTFAHAQVNGVRRHPRCSTSHLWTAADLEKFPPSVPRSNPGCLGRRAGGGLEFENCSSGGGEEGLGIGGAAVRPLQEQTATAPAQDASVLQGTGKTPSSRCGRCWEKRRRGERRAGVVCSVGIPVAGSWQSRCLCWWWRGCHFTVRHPLPLPGMIRGFHLQFCPAGGSEDGTPLHRLC